MLFMDRSVGFNISTYLDCLSTPWATSSSCKRYEHKDPLYNSDPKEVRWERVWDRSNWRYEFWPTSCSEDVTCFINFIEPKLDSFDVMGCQFSYLAVTPGARIADPTTGFFETRQVVIKPILMQIFPSSILIKTHLVDNIPGEGNRDHGIRILQQANARLCNKEQHHPL